MTFGPPAPAPSTTRPWWLDRRAWAVLALGLASGLPSPLLFANLSIWLREIGISRTEIGLLGLIATPYALNFLWAPLLDHLRIPWLSDRLGRRRAWALVMQALLALAIGALALVDPSDRLLLFAGMALVVALFSATQDVAIDAYRIDVFARAEQGKAAALGIWGWHLGGTLIGGAGGLLLANAVGWSGAYALIAGAMALCTLGTLLAPRPPDPDPEPEQRDEPAARGWLATLRQSVWLPLADLLRREGMLLILFFIFIFRFGDALLGRMSGVFYVELGFERAEIAEVAKLYGLGANLLGLVVGGWLAQKIGLVRALVWAGLATALTNLAYAYLAQAGRDRGAFVFAVASDSFTTGLVTVAFVAFLSALCHRAYSATQYALLASLGNLARIWFAASAGFMVDSLDGDWTLFFIGTAVVACAGLPLVLWLQRRYPETMRTDHAARAGAGA